MASRSYIGRLRSDNKVAFVYCHSGAYMDVNGAILQKFFTTEQDAARLISGGGISYIDDDGTPNHYKEELRIGVKPLADFLSITDIMTESLFLWRDGAWKVRSWHIEAVDCKTWVSLKDVIPSSK